MKELLVLPWPVFAAIVWLVFLLGIAAGVLLKRYEPKGDPDDGV